MIFTFANAHSQGNIGFFIHRMYGDGGSLFLETVVGVIGDSGGLAHLANCVVARINKGEES